MSFVASDSVEGLPRTPELLATLERAFVYAEEQAHRLVTTEHLLLALTEDADAIGVLQRKGIDVDHLRNELAGLVSRNNDRFQPGDPQQPTYGPDFLRVLQASEGAASARRPVDGALVLAALIADAQTPASELMKMYGMTFEETVRALRPALRQAAVEPRVAAPPPPPPPARAMPVSEPTAQVVPLRRPAPTAGYNGSAPGLAPQEPPPSPAPPPPAFNGQETWAGPAPEAWAPPAAAPSYEVPPPPAGRQPTEVYRRWAEGYLNGTAPPSEPPAPAVDATGMVRADYAEPDWASYQPEPPPAPPPAPAQQSWSAQQGDAAWSGEPAPDETAVPRTRTARAPRRQVNEEQAPPPAPRERSDGGGSLRRRSGSGKGRKTKARGAAEGGGLVESVPRRLTVGVSVPIEVRITRAEIEATVPASHAARPTRGGQIARSMCVRLRAPEGGFTIEPGSPETQWIEDTLGLMPDDYATWRWQVTPQRSGPADLQLLVSARVLGGDGQAQEIRLPDQDISVDISRSYSGLAARIATVAAIACGAALLGMLIEHFLHVITRLH